MKEAGDGEKTPIEAKRQAQRILNGVMFAWLFLVAVLLAVMATGLVAGGGDPGFDDPERAREAADTLKMLIVLLFFAATLINIGSHWSGKIVAARRFQRSDLTPAAWAFAVSQVICFVVYFLFTLAVFYYRVAGAGEASVMIVATLAAIFASFYFLRMPRYLLNSVFASDQGRDTTDEEMDP